MSMLSGQIETNLDGCCLSRKGCISCCLYTFDTRVIGVGNVGNMEGSRMMLFPTLLHVTVWVETDNSNFHQQMQCFEERSHNNILNYNVDCVFFPFSFFILFIFLLLVHV